MLGFIFGTVCLVALIKVLPHGHGHHGWRYAHGGGCGGHGWHGHHGVWHVQNLQPAYHR